MDASSVTTLLVLVGLVLLAASYQALRRPVQRRLAVRDVIRRKSETALVIAGSLLGTALITGSFIVGDTLDASIRATATTQLGPVDQTITYVDPDAAQEARTAIEGLGDDRIDGVATVTLVQAAFASAADDVSRAEPRGQLLELDFEEARSFGEDEAATGIRGPTPSEGEAVLTQDLAEGLGVAPGDIIRSFIYGSEIRLEVDRVLPRLGLAGFWQGFESRSPNAFVAPGTIAAAFAEQDAGGEAGPPRHIVLVSNRGGVEEGARLTGEVTTAIENVLPPGNVRVEPRKQDTLDDAEVQGDQFAQLFVAIGSFAIVAGVLLLVNIFVMLSEERKSQLGMLRAVGMRRADLIRTFFIEGALYSIVAATIGAILGIGVGWAIVKLAAPIFGGAGDFSLELLFDMDIASMIGGFCLGLLISMLTVTLTSVRISRINIIRAIRDLQEPKLQQTRKRTLIAGAVLAALGAAWFFPAIGDTDMWAAAVLGPLFIAWGSVPLLGRLVGRDLAVIAAAVFSLFWGIFGNTVLDGQFFDAGDLFAFVLQGVSLTFAAVVLLSQMQALLEGGLRRLAARFLSLRLGLAYPLARRFRTGLTLGMFALVIFTMVFIAQMSELFGGQVETATAETAGGADVLVRASEANPPDPGALRDAEGVVQVAALTSGNVLYATSALPDPEPWPVVGVDEDLLEIGPPPLQEEKAPGLESDDEAWRRLLTDEQTVIINPYFLQAGGGPPAAIVEPGDEVIVTDPATGTRATRTVVGIVRNDAAFTGSFMSRGSLESIVGDRAAATRFHVKAGPGADPVEVAAELQGTLIANGVDARTFRALVEEQNEISIQFLRLMQGYLALGLLVGIAGLGVVMVRAVRERRRQVGVLRSLGFQPPQVRRAFLMEAAFVAFAGILIGAVLAVVTSSQLVANGDFGEGLVFAIAWTQIGLLCVSAAFASLLATAWPAQQASSIPPAVALRTAD